jgi:hypothetical protein
MATTTRKPYLFKVSDKEKLKLIQKFSACLSMCDVVSVGNCTGTLTKIRNEKALDFPTLYVDFLIFGTCGKNSLHKSIVFSSDCRRVEIEYSNIRGCADDGTFTFMKVSAGKVEMWEVRFITTSQIKKSEMMKIKIV